MKDDEIHLLLASDVDERATHREREAFLISVVLHLVFILLIIVSPKLFTASQSDELRDHDEKSKELGFLALPEDYQKLMQRPKPPIRSDKDRIAQGKSPKIDPKGLRLPYSEGSTKLPEQSSPGTPEPPSSPAVNLPSQASEPSGDTKEENKRVAEVGTPRREAEEEKKGLHDLIARLEAPGSSIQASVEKARKSGNYGSGGTRSGESFRNFDNRQPNFSVDQPTILTDTQGVDFGPWLRLIYFRVRDNWYAVIPEVIRSGAKGKVVIIFDIRSNGRIENLQLAKSSGLSSYDRAAISSLKLSEPFPNFPPSFAGDQITLQFSYFYNIRL